MTDRATLEALAVRCEQATGPDWSLDCEIARACGYAAPSRPTGDSSLVPSGQMLRATASLDHAMLVAKGYGGEVTFFKDGTAKAFLWQPYPMAIEAKAATPALALCAAALRARAAGEAE